MSRAAKLTLSPNIEYSRLEPLDPTIPQKAVPVEIPILHLHFIFYNYSYKSNAVIMALTGSF
jgi:hypothetical protein